LEKDVLIACFYVDFNEVLKKAKKEAARLAKQGGNPKDKDKKHEKAKWF